MDIRTQRPPKPIPISDIDIEVINAFKMLSGTEEGVTALRWLMNYCGYKITSTVASEQTGELLPLNIIHNEARRGVWVEVRKRIPKNKLNLIEMEK